MFLSRKMRLNPFLRRSQTDFFVVCRFIGGFQKRPINRATTKHQGIATAFSGFMVAATLRLRFSKEDDSRRLKSAPTFGRGGKVRPPGDG